MNEQQKLTKATQHLYTFLISKMIGSLGANVYAFGMSLYILSLTGSALSFATNMIFSILPRTLISPISGMLSDRLPRKALVLGGQAGVILTVLSLSIYTYANDLSLIAIYIATASMSIFGSFSSVAFSASIANLVNEERLQKAMSFNQLSTSIAGIGGPIVGGMLYGFVNIEVFLITFVIAEVIGFLLEATMNFKLYKKETPEKVQGETMVQSFKAGFVYLKKKPVVRAIIFTVLWLNLFFTAVGVGISFILVTDLSMDSELIGIIEAASAIGMLIASIVFATRSNVKFPLLVTKRSTIAMSVVVMLCAVPLFLSFSATGYFIYYVIIMFAFGVLGVITNTPIGVILQTSIEEEFRGRVFGILDMLAMGLMPVGSLIYGILYDIIPAQYILLVSGAILVAVCIICLKRSVIELAHPELKKQQQEQAQPALES